MKLLPLFLFISLFRLSISAQDLVFQGNVVDSLSQESAFCTIRLIDSEMGTTTDHMGNFKIPIPFLFNNSFLVISAVGYKTDTIQIKKGVLFYHIGLLQNEEELKEVVVTGVTKSTLIKENPIPIISITAKMIDQTNESNLVDALVKNVPGLNAVKTGPNISKPFIRGLGYNRVLTLFDGVRQEGQQWGHEHGLEIDPYNIEKAEVIKGPASLMYGSDAMAGVVSFFSPIPNERDKMVHGKFISEYQSNNHLIGNGLRLQFSNKHWAFAVRGSYRIAGNYENNIDGKVYNTAFREANGSAFIGYNSKNGFSNISFTLYDNFQGIPDGSRDSISRTFTKQVVEVDLDDIKNRAVVSFAELNSYAMSPLIQHIQHYRIYSNHHYRMGKSEMDASIAVQQNIRREFTHPTQIDQAGLFLRLNTMNYSVRFNAPKFLNTEVSAGLNGMVQNNKNREATNFTIPNYTLVDIGTFLFAKWKRNRWTVGAGVRYDVRYINGNEFFVKRDSVTGFEYQAVKNDTTGAKLRFKAFEKIYQGFSASLGITFRVDEHISLKLNLARGYRAPNINEFAANGLDPGAHIIYLGNPNFKPEFSWQEDLGASFNYKNWSASIGLFNNNIENYIYMALLVDANGNPIVSTQGNKTFQFQQSAAQLFGFEANVQFHPRFIKGFVWDNNISYTYGINLKKEFQHKGTQGEYLPLIPPFKFFSSINQKFDIHRKFLKSMNLKVELDYSAAQNFYLALYNTESETGAYALLNAALGLEIRYTNKLSLQIQFQVNNLLDNAYQSNLNRLKYFEYYAGSPNGKTGIYGMGRNFCVKLIIPF